MAHVEMRPARGAGLFVRLVYWMAQRRLGRVPTPLGVMAHHRRVLAGVGAFELAHERWTLVDRQLEALALVKVASLVGCRFCIDLGSAIATRAGVPSEKLLALPSPTNHAALTPLEQRVVEYAAQMTETPAHPVPALFHELEAELGVPALVELTAAIAWENFRARFNHAVGAGEEGYSQGMVCLLPEPKESALVAG